MAQYVLMLRDNGSAFQGLSPEEMQRIIERYRNWRIKLSAEGKVTGGQKLRDRAGRVMKRNGSGISVTDGPYAEAKEVIGGFFVVEAGSYDEAVAIANGCPHLDFGTIEVREIELTS